MTGRAAVVTAVVTHDEQRQVYGWARAFAELATAWRPWLEARAQGLTSNRDLQEDLVQEALIALWELDPSRFSAADHGPVRARLTMRMAAVRKSDHRARGGGRRVQGAVGRAISPGLALHRGSLTSEGV